MAKAKSGGKQAAERRKRPVRISSVAQAKLSRAIKERDEALEFQAATAEILSSISRSMADAQPVFDAIVRNVKRLFGTRFVVVQLVRGQQLELAAFDGQRGFERIREEFPQPLAGHSTAARAIRARSAAQLVPIVGNPEASERSQNMARKLGYNALVGVPMIHGDKVVGAIVTGHRDPRPFSERQTALLKAFADQAVIAIENARLFKETKEALEQQTATSEILKVMRGSPTEIQPVLDALAANAARLCEAADAIIQLKEGDVLRFVAHFGDIPNLPAGGTRPISRDVVTGRSVLERRQIHVTDLQSAADDFPQGSAVAKQFGYRTILATPLMRDQAAIGTIMIRRTEARSFSEKHLALVKTFADQAVIAIENVRLFNETKEALERQTATAEILDVISRTPNDVQPVFDTIAANARRLCDASFSLVTRFDGELIHVAAIDNMDPVVADALRNAFPVAPSARGATSRAIQTQSMVHVPDVRADAQYQPGGLAEAANIRSILAVPMLRGDRSLGAIAVSRSQPRAFTEHQIALLKGFADQAVIAIENVRLFNETKEALDQQKASAEVLGAISGSIADTKPVFDKILASCERLFEGELVGVTLADGDTVRLAAYHGPEGERLNKIYPLPLTRESGTGWAILNAAIAHFPDIEAAGVPPGVVAGCRTLGVRAIVFAPMLFEAHGIGAIWVARGQPGAFTEKQIAQLRTFADQAVIAIQNARLFREIQEKSAQLEVANKHKSDFLANMSHELRTPLNAIIGFSEVLLEKMFGEVNEKQVEYLRDIHESGRHLLSLINDILDLSKIEAGRMELELSSFHLPTAVSNAMTLVRERAQRHGIALGVDLDPRLGELQADERKVKQILLNLLSNAVKFTPDGGRVDVRARLDTDKVEIAVKDTGVGIATEDHAAVFEEFKQVGRDYTRKAEGTGLGLALTRRLVELHGGEIGLVSEPGKGSTFTVKLPLR